MYHLANGIPRVWARRRCRSPTIRSPSKWRFSSLPRIGGTLGTGGWRGSLHLCSFQWPGSSLGPWPCSPETTKWTKYQANYFFYLSKRRENRVCTNHDDEDLRAPLRQQPLRGLRLVLRRPPQDSHGAPGANFIKITFLHFIISTFLNF